MFNEILIVKVIYIDIWLSRYMVFSMHHYDIRPCYGIDHPIVRVLVLAQQHLLAI